MHVNGRTFDCHGAFKESSHLPLGFVPIAFICPLLRSTFLVVIHLVASSIVDKSDFALVNCQNFTCIVNFGAQGQLSESSSQRSNLVLLLKRKFCQFLVANVSFVFFDHEENPRISQACGSAFFVVSNCICKNLTLSVDVIKMGEVC